MRIVRIRAVIRTEKEPLGQEGLLWIHTGAAGEEVMSIWENGEWKDINGQQTIYFSDTEPEAKDVLWVSNVDTEEYNNDNTVIVNLYDRMQEVEESLAPLIKMLKYGVIAGDSKNSVREDLIKSAEPIKPEVIKKDTEDTEDTEVEVEGAEAIEPDIEGFEPTVPCISIKMDTAENFAKNYQNLIDGELLWCTDQKKLFLYLEGNFVPAGGGASSGISMDEMMNTFFDSLGFRARNGFQYRLEVEEDGTLHPYYYEYRENVGSIVDSWANSGVYVAPRLFINSVFCGGEDKDEHSFQSCSHNFVELANAGIEDVNLTGLYLLYAPDKDSPWKGIELKGKIKAGETFLIRGAQCSIKTNTTIINVDDYDMEWFDGINPIRFSQTSPVFYLVCSEKGKFYNLDNELVPLENLSRSVYRASSPIKGYIDSVGFNTAAPAEGQKPVNIMPGDSFGDIVFVRYYTLDPVSQANKAYSARTSNGLWTYVNMVKDADEDAVNPLYYYSKNSKIKYTPKAARDHKNIFSTKSTFREDGPNMINITFGKQATYKDSAHPATRCFNWVSVGYYDEYLEYKKVGDSNWKRLFSITEENISSQYPNDTAIRQFVSIYKRLRWETTNHTAVTTHKVIVKGLSAGTYTYRVGRKDAPSYLSEELTFTVVADRDATSFEFVQTSDQQGFNWLEYQAWKKSAKTIFAKHPDIKFTINTGDITQNGNRENEWLDYYDGRQFLQSFEEMFTIGNNDLCGVQEYQLGNGTAGVYKINHINVLHYYTFELDEKNPAIFTVEDTTFYMPSLYSFDYGAFHFVSLNSEWAANTYKVYTGSEVSAGTFKKGVYTNQIDWLRKDLSIWKTGETGATPTDCSKCIVFCHEMPYTIVTHATMTSGRGDGRRGSSLNGSMIVHPEYTYSRLFKEWGIRLVMGGHKHTYSMTQPIYDAPDDYIDESTHKKKTGADLWKNISSEASMQPVIQVTSEKDMKDASFTFDGTKYINGRYELVDKIDAPTYVMCQATGYKLVSNQEIPCRESDNPVWLKSYFGGSPNGNRDAANAKQYYPTYIHYTVRDNEIIVKSMQIINIYTGHDIANNKAGTFNINNQSSAAMDVTEILGGNGYTITL